MPYKSKASTVLFVTVSACLFYALGGGIRANYGIMLGSIAQNAGLAYASVTFVIAVAQLMFGVMQPVFGILALKKSNAFVLGLGVILVIIGLLMIPLCSNMWSLTLFLGVLLPSGFGALSFGIIMAAITHLLDEKTAAAVSGIVSASSGLGSVILSPLINMMLSRFGLRWCMIALSIPAACLFPVSIWFSRVKASESDQAVEKPSVSNMLRTALSTKSYFYLLAAFFTCGFHMAIIETHLFSHMTSSGMADSTASYLFSLYGITTMLGSVATGALCARFPMKYVAGVTFTSRLFIIGGFFLLPKSVFSFGVFAALLGFTGAATVPPISGLTGKLFGSDCLGTLFGILFVSHQIGSFFSSWLGGICIELTGGYTLIWFVSAGLALFAGWACLMLKEPRNVR